MTARYLLVRERMAALGITEVMIRAALEADQRRELAAPRFQAIDAPGLAMRLGIAARVLDLDDMTMRGQHVQVYVYPVNLVYAWRQAPDMSILVGHDGSHLAMSNAPYWALILDWRAGKRTA